jgi:aryl-alcohol dehydrogenase-like predicted oxidoreductase
MRYRTLGESGLMVSVVGLGCNNLGRPGTRTEDLAGCGYAAERGVALLDVAIGGLAAQPAVSSVIAGATSSKQVAANAAAGAWEPSAADLAALTAL